jgi:hypothetical protein
MAMNKERGESLQDHRSGESIRATKDRNLDQGHEKYPMKNNEFHKSSVWVPGCTPVMPD